MSRRVRWSVRDARVQLGARAINVVRAGKLVYSVSKLSGDGAALASGDVVRPGG